MGVIKFVVLLIISVVSLYFIITSIQNYQEAQKEVEKAQEEVDKTTAEARQAKKEFEQTLATATSNHEGIAKAYSVYQREFKEKYPESPGTESWPESWQQIMNRLWPGEFIPQE
jgi:F0F1-type ATP synthase membrane subunit b/b'